MAALCSGHQQWTPNSDLLALPIEDVKGYSPMILREKKTGKSKDFPVADISITKDELDQVYINLNL